MITDYRAWSVICIVMAHLSSNERGLRLQEFATFNDLELANTFGHHKASRRWTRLSPKGQHHNQIDYFLVRKRFRSGVNSARTWRFPEADTGSNHDLLMMSFNLRLKRISELKHKTQDWPWNAERTQCVRNLPGYGRWEDCTSHHCVQWRYRHGLNNHHLQHSSDWNSRWDPWKTSSEEKNLGHCRNSWSVWQWRELRKRRFEPEGSVKYREVNNNIKRCMKKAKENWIGEQWSKIEENLRKNNYRKAYQLVKDLTTVKQGKVTTPQDLSGKCLTEERQILNQWTEYCSQLYNHKASGDPSCTELSPDRHRGSPPHPLQRSGGCRAIIKEREVGRSWHHPSRTGPSR